jgi:hypothetical protein
MQLSNENNEKALIAEKDAFLPRKVPFMTAPSRACPDVTLAGRLLLKLIPERTI